LLSSRYLAASSIFWFFSLIEANFISSSDLN
jgi:hypothetical protein